MIALTLAAAAMLVPQAPTQATTRQPAGKPEPVAELGPNLERVVYPWPVERMPVTLAGAPATMAFMDVKPERPNGRSVVLLHGKNFCGATWEATARALAASGYRVLIPDQLGFCKSSKPEEAQYSFGLLVHHTARLMQQRGIAKAAIVGHSMGGMLAMRFSIARPELVERLVLVNPLGLADRSLEGVPYTPVETLFAAERKTSFDTIKAYQLRNYYHGQWRPDYDRWVRMQAGMYAGAGRDTVAWAQAKTSEMIYTQPVAHELGRILTPTTLIVGTLDKTAFGRAQAPDTLAQFLKAIPDLAPVAVKRFPNARLVRLPGLGHSPQVEAPEQFQRVLFEALGGVPVKR